MRRPIGYFVHHQGRGHAERATALVNALPDHVPVMLFSARDDIFPPLADQVSLTTIPSLFERPQRCAAVADLDVGTPPTLHCAPLGWPSITRAIATITQWFDSARPALFVTDVSAELAQLARIASIPCVPVVQHGDRGDPGHMAAYEGAIALLAPYAAALEQPDRPSWWGAKTHYAPGLGVPHSIPERAEARRKLGLAADADIVVVVSGAGGSGTPGTPLTLGARAEPRSLWITIGAIEHQWHATAPANLVHHGWVDTPELYIAAADRIVSSAGDTTVHMVAAAARPWVVIPEWRYFDEQRWKARMLAAAGAAVALDHWPSHVGAWHDAWRRAADLSLAAQRALVDPDAATRCAAWLDDLAAQLSDDAIGDVVNLAERAA